MNRSWKLSLVLISATGSTSLAAPTVRSGTGANAAGLQSIVDQFRGDVGGPINAPNTGPFASGRREINWDAVPAGFSSPNNMPGNFFNNNSRRGANFTTPGTGFAVSRNAADASDTTVRFNDINPSYAANFQVFSQQKLFAVKGSTVMDVTFAVPVSPATSATVNGFGAVFADVDLDSSTRIEFYNEANALLLSQNVVPLDKGLSFFGASWSDGTRVSRVRITTGNAVFGETDGFFDSGFQDVVVMDDFIYGEPIPAPGALALVGLGGAFVGRRRR